MQQDAPSNAPRPESPALEPGPYMAWARAWWPTIGLILVVTLARLACIAWLSPYALVEDEAHYWEWSRRLDLSYYSKGPGIAWTIALGTWLFGDTELGVRFFAPIFGAVLAGTGAALGWLASGDRRVALLAAAVILLTPVFQVASLLMTIDGPMLAMWALAAAAAMLALRRSSGPAWIGLGAAIAAGFLYKYTILLIVPGLVIYAIMDRRRLRLSPRAGLWAIGGLAVALLGLAPVTIWNAQHDWVTVRHLLGHLGVAGGDVPARPDEGGTAYSPLWTLEYLGIQLAMAGPAVIIGLVTLGISWRRHRRAPDDSTSGALLLGLAALPVLVFYLGVTGFTRVEGNWPVAAYVTLGPLAGLGFFHALRAHNALRRDWLAKPRPRPRTRGLRPAPETPGQVLWHWVVGYGLLAGLLMPRMDLLTWMPVVGDLLPVERLTRAIPTAEAVSDQLDKVRAEGRSGEPFVAAGHYGQASLMAFYLPGQPIVHCASAAAPGLPEKGLYRGRASQYDHWPRTDLTNPETIERLRGRPAVLVGGSRPRWRTGFASVRELPPHPREDVPPILIGREFRGFPEVDAGARAPEAETGPPSEPPGG